MMNGKRADPLGDGVEDTGWDPSFPVSHRRIASSPGTKSSKKWRSSAIFPTPAEFIGVSEGAKTGGCLMFTPSRTTLPGINSSGEGHHFAVMNGKRADPLGDGVEDPDWDPRIPVSYRRIASSPGTVSSNSRRSSVTFPPLFNTTELTRGAGGAETGGFIMFTPSRSALPAGISSSSEEYWAINEAAASSIQVNRALHQHSSRIAEAEPFVSGASEVLYDRPRRNSYLASNPQNLFGLGSSLQQDTIGVLGDSVRTEMRDLYADTNRDSPESITYRFSPLKVNSESGGRQEPAPTFQATHGNPSCFGTGHKNHDFSKVSSHSLLRDREKKGKNMLQYPPQNNLSQWQEESGELWLGSKISTSPPSQGGANLLSSRSRTNTTTSQPSTSKLAAIPFEKYIASSGAYQLDVGYSNTEEESMTINGNSHEELVSKRSEDNAKPSCSHIIERSYLLETGHDNIWSEEGLSKDCIASERHNCLECSSAVLPRENQHESQNLPEMNICYSESQQEPVFTDSSSNEKRGCKRAGERTVPTDWQTPEKSSNSAIIHKNLGSWQLNEGFIDSGYSTISLSENPLDTKNPSETEGGNGQSLNGFSSIHFSSIPREVTQPCSKAKTVNQAAVAGPSQDKKNISKAIRPLHAYNFFFYDVRDCILRMDEKGRSEMSQYLREQQEKGDAANSREISRYLNPKLLLSLHGDEHKNRLLINHWHKDRSKRRPHRKNHGKIAFGTLNQACSTLWRTLPEHGKHFYRTVAEADRVRYETEVRDKES